jgi:hypothetical protein
MVDLLPGLLYPTQTFKKRQGFLQQMMCLVALYALNCVTYCPCPSRVLQHSSIIILSGFMHVTWNACPFMSGYQTPTSILSHISLKMYSHLWLDSHFCCTTTDTSWPIDEVALHHLLLIWMNFVCYIQQCSQLLTSYGSDGMWMCMMSMEHLQNDTDKRKTEIC